MLQDICSCAGAGNFYLYKDMHFTNCSHHAPIVSHEDDHTLQTVAEVASHEHSLLKIFRMTLRGHLCRAKPLLELTQVHSSGIYGGVQSDTNEQPISHDTITQISI